MATSASSTSRRMHHDSEPLPNGNGGILPSHRAPSLPYIDKDRLTTSYAPPSSQPTWLTTFLVPLPFAPSRRLRLVLPIPPAAASLFRKRTLRPKALVAFCAAILLVVVYRKVTNSRNNGRGWGEAVTNAVTGQPASTCVFGLDELREIYEWEVKSGNYPTRRRIPGQIGVPHRLFNPAIHPDLQLRPSSPSRTSIPIPPFLPEGIDNATVGIGPSRQYHVLEVKPPNVAYPPRPILGSAIDLDKVMQYCDFNTDQYVRDCLQVMRVAGGLDNGPRIRRGNIDEWKYIFSETRGAPDKAQSSLTNARSPWLDDPKFSPSPLPKNKPHLLDLNTRMIMPPRAKYPELDEGKGDCDPARPRIFHIYWSGPFTDKPYMTLASYLYTQPLGLHLPPNAASTAAQDACRPQFWVWINPGVQASVPNPNARQQLFDTLKANPWSQPFLHPRFSDVIKFKLWNTTERLDALPELEGWRSHGVLGKLVVKSKAAKLAASSADVASAISAASAPSETDTSTTGGGGSTVENDPMVELKQADAAQVVMSDLARFLVTHAYGGIYLDVDNVLLRDWEELWGWKGAFAMRWSVHDWYNTAILRMHQNSALGSFLLRTAMQSTIDSPFHPYSITLYVHDAHLRPLLYRIPDALFDPDFLQMEGKQRDRPPFPYYSWDSKFEEFFDTPARSGGEAGPASYDAFYRGAYAYHWHNNWEKPVDIGRNWPDLGERFASGERMARMRLAAASASLAAKTAHPSKPTAHVVGGAMGGAQAIPPPPPGLVDGSEDSVLDDVRDLSWSAVLKRTFEGYIRGERPNMYGEWLVWED